MLDRLEAIHARWADATKGPWVCSKSNPDGTICVYASHLGPCRVVIPVCETTEVNGKAIAAAPEDIAWLCAEVERLRAQIETLVSHQLRP